MRNMKSIERVALLIGFLLIAIGIAYYFFVSVPRRDMAIEQKDCLELGQKTAAIDEKHLTKFTADYAYVPKLKTCVYKSQFTPDLTYKGIKDLYTSKVLASCIVDPKTDEPIGNSKSCEEYDRLDTKLFK